LFWHGNNVRRDSNATYYWTAWILWASLAVLALGKAVLMAWQAWIEPDPTPATLKDAYGFIALATVGLVFWLMIRSVHLWRRGPLWTWTAWKALRRESELARTIRSLADDVHTDMDGDTVEMAAQHLDLDWLERIAAYLAVQPHPRVLSVAIEATAPPQWSQMASLIRALADDVHTDMNGNTVEEVAQSLDLDRLECIVSYLADQPHPRVLGAAIRATAPN
jgi:hypothetical protein